MRKTLALALALVAMVGFSAVRGRMPQEPPSGFFREPEVRRPLELETIEVRLLLGIGDEQSRPWNGKVAVDPGEVVGVEPWRFRAGDKLEGRDAWQSHSLPIRKAAAAKAAAKKAARKAAAQAREKGGPSNTGPAITPTGVVVRMKAPADSTLTARLGGFRGSDRAPEGLPPLRPRGRRRPGEARPLRRRSGQGGGRPGI